MNYQKHSYLMIGLLVVGAARFLSGGVGGGALFLLWPLACLAMMFMMMQWMSGRQDKPDHTHNSVTHNSVVDHTHEDGLTHSHR